MAIAIQMDFAGATSQQYDRVLELMGLTPGGRGPAGAISHFATETETGLRVVDVWQSREAYEKFAAEQIGPLSVQAGITEPPALAFFDVHSYLTPGAPAIEESAARTTMSVEELTRLDDMGMRAWDEHDIDGFLALFADEFVWRDTSAPAPITTRAGLRDYMSAWFTAFPDMRTHTTNRVVGDNAVAAEVAFTGTNTGPLQMGQAELPATGRAIIGHGCYFLHVEDGKVVEFSSQPDTAGMLTQLGLMPSAPAAPGATS